MKQTRPGRLVMFQLQRLKSNWEKQKHYNSFITTWVRGKYNEKQTKSLSALYIYIVIAPHVQHHTSWIKPCIALIPISKNTLVVAFLFRNILKTGFDCFGRFINNWRENTNISLGVKVSTSNCGFLEFTFSTQRCLQPHLNHLRPDVSTVCAR